MICSIDGSFMLHRARFVAGKNNTPTRDHTIAIFIGIFLRTLQQFRPSRVYIYFDRERSYHRLQLYADYKGQRKVDDTDPTLVAYKAARDFLVEVLPTLGFITILEDGIEADDFAYLTAKRYEPGVHITDDKDWFNNLFPQWSLYRPKAGELFSYDQFCTMVSHTENPRMIYLIARAIVGDRSDNIPGVRGVPWEQALVLAPRIFTREDLGSCKYAKKVLDNMGQVRHNINLMTPMWVIQSKEALQAFEKAEQSVETNLGGSFVRWSAFCDKLAPVVQRDMVRSWVEYNGVVNKLSYT